MCLSIKKVFKSNEWKNIVIKIRIIFIPFFSLIKKFKLNHIKTLCSAILLYYHYY
jgi:hypothetical protein